MEKHGMNDVIRRSILFKKVIIVFFGLLIIRLFWIQIINGEDYKNLAIKQQTKDLKVSLPRGIIYDKNGIKLTNTEKEKTLFIFKRDILDNKESLEKLKKALGYSDRELKKLLDSNNSVIELSLKNKKIDLKEISSIKEVRVEEKVSRNNNENLLTHVVGYVNKKDNKGISGIEKSFDDEPLKVDPGFGKRSVFVDARQKIIPGVDAEQVRTSMQGLPNSLKLTIDYYIQKKVEDILDDQKKNGAVVVSEVETGDIVAMASRPNINLNNIEKELSTKDQRFYNKALELSYPPGSIFKIVVLIAGLEEGIISLDDEIICKGYEKIDNVVIKCNKPDGHGKISVLQGFYKSCNSTFIQIGKKIGAKKIIDTAKRIGFGSKVEIGLDDENKGALPKGKDLLGPSIGNISLGQGKIEATPLQVTNMMVTLANNGIKKDLSIVDSYVTQEGYNVKKIKRDPDERIISEKVALQIRKALEGVVKNGTAQGIDQRYLDGAGGKTGSAQATLDGEKVVHAWFAGYFPENNPKYVITVFIEKGDSGSSNAVPIFNKIAKEIKKINIKTIKENKN
ncbi:stage V sporulation protein D [Gottschalkia purinilytica]|uniref:Stage V sporulation protein D n=1 Tax=Gottschalkia purinilytica TaxID=1503 RepID=A0A0L0WEG8_GOTPU|nr:penicillin-binding transpeptidase domain-containing protein [Gottschalkia purinilytica]KNF09873.1 stage V sporulation protein D [Gottschalkia purinilytica]